MKYEPFVFFRQFLLSCISLNLANTRTELHNISQKTLLAVQQTRLDVNLKQCVDVAIVELFKLRAIEISGDKTNIDCSVQLNSTVVIFFNIILFK